MLRALCSPGRALLLCCALAALAPLASATDLHLKATTGDGRATTAVPPGATVEYVITGELSDDENEGLAMFAFDLTFGGEELLPAAAPTEQPMLNFAPPLGLSNPAGFGGTPLAGALVQVGGAQNTILNSFAPFPTGNVITGVAAKGSPQVLATGTLTAPAQVGDYRLSIGNVMANVLKKEGTGVPFWLVDAAGVGDTGDLEVNVVALTADKATLSIAQQGTQTFALDAGAARAGRIFWLLGTTGGTDPGQSLPNNQHLPLNPSPYLDFTMAHPNTAPLSNSLGHLDDQGKATSSFVLPHVPAAMAGLVLHHAYVLLQPIDFVSNPVQLSLVP
jgi:hypothetical protein